MGWPGEEVAVRQLTIKQDMSLNKKIKTFDRLNNVIKALNSDSFDIFVWLNGFNGKVLSIKNNILQFRKFF